MSLIPILVQELLKFFVGEWGGEALKGPRWNRVKQHLATQTGKKQTSFLVQGLQTINDYKSFQISKKARKRNFYH